MGDNPFELNSPDDHPALDRFDSKFLFLEGDTVFIRPILPTMSP